MELKNIPLMVNRKYPSTKKKRAETNDITSVFLSTGVGRTKIFTGERRLVCGGSFIVLARQTVLVENRAELISVVD